MAWDRILADIRPDIVVHLAAETGTGQSLTEATRHGATNVTGTTQMLDAFSRRKSFPEKIILTSSRAVYGEGAWLDQSTQGICYPGQRSRSQLERAEWSFPGLAPVPSEAAQTWPHPTSIYGATKLAQEHVIRAWCQAYGTQPVTLRLQNVYGPGQSLINSYTGIVSLFCRLAKSGRSIPVYEDGWIVRDFVFIDDVARAIEAACVLDCPARAAYDIGSGQASTIMMLAQSIAAHYGAPEPHITGAFRHGDVRHASCIVDAAKNHLGWTPSTNLASGLAALIQWIDREISEQN